MNELKIENVQVYRAIKALKQLNEHFVDDTSNKKSLLDADNEQSVFLQVTLKKIPLSKNIKFIYVPLKNSLLKDSTEVCLLAGDLDKRDRKAEIEPDVLHYKNLLREHNISKITEVLTLRQLRTEYKTYETKHQLVAAYDNFLADNRITGVLHRFLGKSFFNKRKLPIQISMKTSNLKEQVEKALAKTVLYVSSHGNSCSSEVAHLKMDNKEIFQNIKAVIKALVQYVPGKSQNIHGIYVKTAKSKAVPVYLSYSDPNEVQFYENFEQEDVEAEELSTLANATVKVFRSGKVIVKRMKGSKSKGLKNRKKGLFKKSKSDISAKKSLLGRKKKINKVKSISVKKPLLGQKKKVKSDISAKKSLLGRKRKINEIELENKEPKQKKKKTNKSNIPQKKSSVENNNNEIKSKKPKMKIELSKSKIPSKKSSEVTKEKNESKKLKLKKEKIKSKVESSLKKSREVKKEIKNDSKILSSDQKLCKPKVFSKNYSMLLNKSGIKKY